MGTKNFIVLEYGKTYLNRSNQVVGPLIPTESKLFLGSDSENLGNIVKEYPFFDEATGITFTSNGRYYHYIEEDHPSDLIKEYIAPDIPELATKPAKSIWG